ncbi:MAG: hypothetical protein DRJ03_23795 [Chloroflexi bacterium]|nr:MAG: hypothetical protein DRI81_06395 [Chloroflexota bacterium]RLC79264.1 MAG: hypothetical protein DRJ03_23795 [Chloroflexota bacterium]HEY72926.1 hypothetical protein [Thermoflexia bacterium]
MLIPSFTISALDQSRALVQGIKALDVIETGNPLEREVALLLQKAFELRLQEMADAVSTWDICEILSIGLDARVH